MKTMIRISLFASLFLLFVGNTFSQDVYEAIVQGDLLLVKKAISENSTLLNQKNANEQTPLLLACENGQAGIVEFLLSQGADPNIGDRENSLPIHLAAVSGSIESLDLLLALGMDIDIQDDFGMTPLLFALSRRQVDMAAYIIDLGADINLQSNNGWAPVHLAIATRSDDIAYSLLEKGAQVNVSLETGATPLHSAVSYGNTDMVKSLIEHGADMKAASLQGERPLSWAVNPNTYDAAVFLIENGADFNHKNNHGATMLHNIAGRGTAMGNIKLLLEKGADINVQDDWGRTPLYMAAWSNDPGGMSQYLILNGAEVNPSNCKDENTCTCFPNFSTALHAAVRHGQIEMAKNLVMSGAKINIYNDEGQTPLHCAVLSGDPEMVQYLIDHGAFINVPEEEQGSAELHMAVAMGYSDITDVLIENGADPDLLDKCGKTPFDYAMYYNHKALGYDLLADGADDQHLKDYISCEGELSEAIGPGEAKVWFLGHSAWAVKTQNHFLVFDYFCNTWDRKPDDSCLASGYIIPEEIKDLNVTVFVTHSHGDHYDPRIFNWKETVADIDYVLCWPQQTDGQEYTLIPVHEERMVEDMNVYVHHSTDLGGGYLVEVDGLSILHMGDHANGEDGLMEEFTAEVDILKEKAENIDILFAGIRGCSLGAPEQVKRGIYYTLETLQPKLFVPMHNGSHSFAYKAFVDDAREDGFEMEMKYVFHKGDRFKYSKSENEEVTSL